MPGDLLALLRKELLAVRRNLGLFVVLLVVLPGAFAAGTAVYEQTIPQDVPVGVVDASEETTEADRSITRLGLQEFADPVDYDSAAAAERALLREEVYLVVHVPADLNDAESNATFTVVSDRSFVPFEEPVNETVGVMETQFDAALPASVGVEQAGVGTQRTLSAYLVPTGLFAFVTLYALVYLPHQLRSERLVLDRVRTESRLEAVAAAKLLFYGAALAVPLAMTAAVTSALEYDLTVFSPVAVAATMLSFLALGAVGLAVAFALRLGKTALYVDLGLAAGVLVFSGLLFPVGFFSPIERLLTRSLPTHYAVITLRGGMLRDVPASLYADYLAWLALAAVTALVVLELSLITYRRRR